MNLTKQTAKGMLAYIKETNKALAIGIDDKISEGYPTTAIREVATKCGDFGKEALEATTSFFEAMMALDKACRNAKDAHKKSKKKGTKKAKKEAKRALNACRKKSKRVSAWTKEIKDIKKHIVPLSELLEKMIEEHKNNNNVKAPARQVKTHSKS